MKGLIISIFILLACLNVKSQCIIELQPGAAIGKDARVFSLPCTAPYAIASGACDTVNFETISVFGASTWTWWGVYGNLRGYLEFDLDTLNGTSCQLDSAKLSLYHYGQVQSGNNATWLNRVTQFWYEDSITWINQPTIANSISGQDYISIPQSTSPTQDYVLDVSDMVNYWDQNPGTNYGFAFRIQNPVTYKNMRFATSDCPDPTKWPKLTLYFGCPPLSVSPDTTLCSGSAVQLFATGNGTFSWSPSSSLSNPSIANPVATPTVSTTYTVTITDTAGCQSVDSVTVSLKTGFANAGPYPTICLGNTATLNANGGVSYQWTPAGGLSCPTCASTMASPAVTTSYKVVVIDSGGCVDSSYASIRVLPANTIDAGIDTIICPGDSIQLYGSINNLCQTNGFWAGGQGVFTPDSTTLNALYVPSVQEVANGSVTLILDIRDSITPSGLLAYEHSGGDTIFMVNTSNNAITRLPNIGSNDITAMGYDTANKILYCFTAISDPFKLYKYDMVTCTYTMLRNYFADGITVHAADYDVDNGILYAVGMPIFNSNAAQTLYTANLSTGVLTAVGLLGLNGNSLNNVQHLGSDGINGLAYDPSTGMLYGVSYQDTLYAIDPGSGTATSIGFVNAPVIRSMGYDFNTNKLYALNAVQTLYEIDKTNASVVLTLAPSSTMGQVSAATYVPQNRIGIPACVDTIQINISEPTAVVSNDTSICVGESVQLTASGGASFSWTPSTGLSDAAISNPIATPGVSTFYTVVVSQSGCNDTSLVFVQVNPLPTGSAEPSDTTIILGTSVQLLATGGTSYSWLPSFGLNCRLCPDPIATPQDGAIHVVTITDSNGCQITDTVRIKVIWSEIICELDNIFIPNAFTPNGDSKNDELFVFGNNFTLEQFIIYDRWGNKVFETTDINIGWDGTYGNNALGSGVFVYYLVARCPDNQQLVKKGDITLIR